MVVRLTLLVIAVSVAVSAYISILDLLLHTALDRTVL
jgi:hypothetical protein